MEESQSDELIHDLEFGTSISSTLNLQRVLLIVALGLSSFIYGSKVCPDDFTKCVKKPTGLWLAMLVSVLVAPLTAYVVTLIMPLNSSQGITLLVIACCPAGTLSPIFAFYTRSDVCLCLSVIVLSVLMSVGMIPLGVFLCSSAYTELDLTHIPNTVIVIVLGLMIGGLTLGMTFRMISEKWADRFVVVSSAVPIVVTIVMIVIVGIKIPHSVHIGVIEFFAVLIYFVVVMSVTYSIGALAGQTHGTCRAMTFCSASKSMIIALTMIHASFTGDILLEELPIPTLFLTQYIVIGALSSVICHVYGIYVPDFYMDE